MSLLLSILALSASFIFLKFTHPWLVSYFLFVFSPRLINSPCFSNTLFRSSYVTLLFRFTRCRLPFCIYCYLFCCLSECDYFQFAYNYLSSIFVSFISINTFYLFSSLNSVKLIKAVGFKIYLLIVITTESIFPNFSATLFNLSYKSNLIILEGRFFTYKVCIFIRIFKFLY